MINLPCSYNLLVVAIVRKSVEQREDDVKGEEGVVQYLVVAEHRLWNLNSFKDYWHDSGDVVVFVCEDPVNHVES